MNKNRRKMNVDNLYPFDNELARVNVSNLDTALHLLGQGSSWDDRLPLPQYTKLTKGEGAEYLTHRWSMPARYAFLSITHKRPKFAVLESLGKKVTNAWEWEDGVPEKFQPSVWGGAALVRDRRLRSGKALVEVLSQALEGADSKQERMLRAGAVLGGGWAHAAQLQALWGPMAWKGMVSWGKEQLELLEMLSVMGEKENKTNHMWQKWCFVSENLAEDREEARLWREEALARAIASWKPFVRVKTPMASQGNWERDDLRKLKSIDVEKHEVSALPEKICQALAELGEVILDQERERESLLIQDNNVKVLHIVSHHLFPQKSSPARSRLMKAFIKPIPYSYKQKLQEYGEIMGVLTSTAKREFLMEERGIQDVENEPGRTLKM